MKQAGEIRTCSHCICRHSGGILWTGSRRTGTGRSHCKESSGNVRFEGAGSSVVIGEGGSGGALALAVGNEVWMMENATYTILSPEGFASILWKDSRKAPEAAEVMKVTAAHLKELGIIERIIPEEYPASEENLPEIAEYMKIRMKQFLEKQSGKSGEQIAQERYERFRKM